MKKKYVKPDLVYENFELANTVAANCTDAATNANHSDGSTCAYNFYGAFLFFASGNNACAVDPKEIGFEDYCYQSGSDTTNFFGS